MGHHGPVITGPRGRRLIAAPSNAPSHRPRATPSRVAARRGSRESARGVRRFSGLRGRSVRLRLEKRTLRDRRRWCMLHVDLLLGLRAARWHNDAARQEESLSIAARCGGVRSARHRDLFLQELIDYSHRNTLAEIAMNTRNSTASIRTSVPWATHPSPRQMPLRSETA